MTPSPSEVPGLDLPGLQRFFDQHVHEASGPLMAELISGGRSNITFRLTDGTTTWVLRRPPLGGLTPSAHDMRREYRVVEALHGSAVPVAEPVVYCEDAAVIGAPFAVVRHVDGSVLRTQHDIEGLSTDDLLEISNSLVSVMAALHAVDPREVGLEDFGRPEGYLRRQVARWTDQWERVATTPAPDVDRLSGLLAANVPEESGHCVVHGDIRIDNAILDADRLSHIRALLDWEMATLGDPLADLALHLVYRDPAFSPVLGGDAASTDPRMPSTDHLVERYAAESARSTDQLEFHLALAYLKSAVIAAGIHARHTGGHMAGGDFGGVEQSIPLLAASGLEAYRHP